MNLNGRVGIVTGASRGLGTYIAEEMARRGSHLALAARNEEDLQRTAKDLERFGTHVIAVPTDVTKRADLKTLVRRTTRELGPVEVLVNNAGVEKLARFDQVDLEEIESIIKTNVTAVEVLTRLVVADMVQRRSGHIVNISSMAGKSAVPYNTVYASSKHALVGFSWSLRQELKGSGVGVSVICPIFVTEAGMYASWSDQNPPAMTKAVTPSDVAAATIKAIERDLSEVSVARGLGRLADVVHAISPELAAAIARRAGLYDYLAEAAKSSGAQAH